MISKGIIVLQALNERQRLKAICKDFDISYDSCIAVSKGLKEPPFAMMDKFQYLIPVEFWFEEPSNEFIEKIKNNTNKN